MTTDLTLGDRRDPADSEVDTDVNDSDDPEPVRVVGATVHETEDDGEDNAT